jgi:uncharacterized membrane protein
MIGKHLPLYLLTGIVVLLLDAVFIYGIKDYFNRQIKLVQGTDVEPDFIAIILTYVIMVSGLYYFIIKERKSVTDAAFLGFVIYAVYELTTKSLLKNWRWKTVIIDTTWGSILFSLATYIVYLV